MRIEIRENYRVEVTPDFWCHGNPEAHAKDACKKIAASISRHVDGVLDVGVRWDDRTVCSHCGRDWEEYEDGCPCCCDEAQDEWAKARGEAL